MQKMDVRLQREGRRDFPLPSLGSQGLPHASAQDACEHWINMLMVARGICERLESISTTRKQQHGTPKTANRNGETAFQAIILVHLTLEVYICEKMS